MPPKHKESNTIKFLPFAERIANINVDVIHRIGHRNEEENEDGIDSFFYQALEKWSELNCSQHWVEFQREVGRIQTLAQLLLLRERVVNTLLKHLEMKDPLTQQAILEMVVALARDLRQDFYPYYPEFLSRIIALLGTKEAEVLEWAFQCLAYLFKFLWRCMVRNIAPVLSSLLPLLSSKRPKYIHYFAADSFAFLARKVKDQSAFMNLILTHLKEHPEDAEGCGRLVFAWLRGIKGQLHSCAQKVLLLLFQSLGDPSVKTDMLAELLSHTVSYLATEIRPGGLTFFWDATHSATSFYITELNSGKSIPSNAVYHVMRLVRQLCDHCEAVHLTTPGPLVQQLVSLLGLSASLTKDVLDEIAQISAILLISCSVSLSQNHAVKLTSKVLALQHPSIILNFVEKLLSWGSLETLVLPRLLELLASAFVSNGAKGIELQLLARLVRYKAPPFHMIGDTLNITSYPLDFTSACQRIKCPLDDVTDSLLSVLNIPKEANTQLLLDTLENKLCALLILPHVHPLCKIKLKSSLEQLLAVVSLAIQESCQNLKLDGSAMDVDDSFREETLSRLLLLMFSSVEAGIRAFGFSSAIERLLPFDTLMKTLLTPARIGCCRLGALRVLDVYLSAMNAKDIPGESSLLIYNSLENNLAAAHHMVREMTCRVLMSLPVAEDVHSMFAVFLEAETTSASITDYRAKLQLLQKLSYDSTQVLLLKDKAYERAPLLFLCGSLYINFQLLWEPIFSIIASYATGMAPHDFWPVFHEQLCVATDQRDMSPNHGTASHPAFTCDVVTEHFSAIFDVDDKPDHANYRLLLWQATHHFSDVCEARNRDIATAFLTFINKEYLISNAEVANTWNIKKHDAPSSHETLDNDYDDDDDDDKEETQEEVDIDHADKSEDEDKESDSESEAKQKTPRTRQRQRTFTSNEEEHLSRKLMSKTLLSMLGLLAKFKSPRSVYRESELSQIYHDLLSHKNPDIQKLALDCIMTYKHKFLAPYSQHLYALIDNKSFKNEMISFNIDKDSSTIREEHRPQLIPIIMRIVYSKMVARTGMRTGGKAGPAMRRSLVLRFLAGCHKNEMLVFVQMAFRFYNHLLQDDIVEMVNSIQTAIHLENVVPPRRLQSAVNLLSVVQEKFGGLMGEELLALILRLLVSVGATVNGILLQRESVHSGYLSALRLLRTTCLEVLTHFFDRFEAYPWSVAEIDTVLKVFIWPVIDRLPIEGIHSPTALLKLFLVWSQHPRYFILFGAHANGDLHKTPLPAIISLLQGAKTHPSVSSTIMELIENLLTLRDHGDTDFEMEVDDTLLEEKASPIPVTHTLPISEEAIAELQLPAKLNLGSKLLFPHVSSILERLQLRLSSSAKRGPGLNKRELVVLSAVSEMVRAPDTSALLAQLLLPLLTRRCAVPHEDEEPILKMMSTLNFLVRNVNDPQNYMRPLAGLFSNISGVASRKLLVALVGTVAEATAASVSEQKEIMEHTARLVSRLNAYDKRWIEQPDFDTRLDAFKEVQLLLDAGKLTVDLGAIIIHHCFHVIRSEKDMSLRDFAAHCLRRVAPALCLQHQSDAPVCNFLLDTTILSLIRHALNKSSSEVLQSEAVLLLGEMAMECRDLHPVLKDLHLLTNKVDQEVDFFQNLQHLQLHRKTRALLKFCEVFRGLEHTPNPRSLTQFILPLASQYLCSEKYAGKNSLVDAAINVIGVVCRLLPWHQYEAILRYYLLRLRSHAQYQKQLVRIIVIILDAFHYDLSRAQNTSQNATNTRKEGQLKEDTNVEVKKISLENEIAVIRAADVGENEEEKDSSPENLEYLLEEEKEMEVEEVQDVEMKQKVLAIDRVTTLCPSAAVRVIKTITSGLLPQLYRALTARTQVEGAHRLNKKQVRNNDRDHDAEEEEILRVPMALAVVKLLQRLPVSLLTQNLPGILVRLCTFLKSRLESVRRVTRETLQKIMISLGPSYLVTLLREMTALLTRGYEVHVLMFSIHSVLVSLKDKFSPGDIDRSVQYIIEVCKTDLFGYAAEEKEEGKVAAKLHEARSTKSYDTLYLTSQFVSESCLTDLLLPFKDIIQTAHSHKIINKASECLRHVVMGLSENTMVQPKSLLVFAFGVASESIPSLALKGKKDKAGMEKEKEAQRRPDCFIIKEAPKQRVGMTSTDAARIAARMNAHLFVEFGLRLIYSLLKHEKLKTVEDCRPLLDPLVPLLNNCLTSQHVKLSILALQCLSWLFRMDLPALHKHIIAITSSIFSLLHKFAAAGLSKGDNFDLVVAAFKAVAVLVRDIKYHTLEQDQLKALLLYAEQDLADVNRHATAFTLLKSILSRKLIVPEIHDVMDKVATLSITAELAHVRLQARQVFQQFLMDYPLGKKLERHLSFYLSQLNYELQPGRESALEMVHSVIISFPVNILSAHSGLFFLMLGARLVNDDAPDCRRMVAQCIGKMLSRLSKNDRDHLYNMSLLWLREKKVSHRRLSAQLCGLFVLTEKESFSTRLPDLLPVIVAQFSPDLSGETNEPGRFVKAPSALEGEKVKKPESERMQDHHLYQVLQLILKICSHCSEWLKLEIFCDHVYNLTEHAQNLLAHPHEWVRLSAAQFITHVLTALDISRLTEAARNSLNDDEYDGDPKLGFFRTDTALRLKSMILDHCAQLFPGSDVGQPLLFQVVKNLVIFADILKDLNQRTPASNMNEGSNGDGGDDPNDKEEKSQKISLIWLVRRMRRIVHAEVAQAPKFTIMRTMVLNWTAAVVVKLDASYILPVLHHMLAPIVRELSSDEPAPEGSPAAQLRTLAKEVGSVIKKIVGTEHFMQAQSRLQSQLLSVRAERKRQRKQDAVAEPVKAAKRKIQKQVQKKEAKKRRMMKLGGKRKFVKKKEVDLEAD